MHIFRINNTFPHTEHCLPCRTMDTCDRGYWNSLLIAVGRGGVVVIYPRSPASHSVRGRHTFLESSVSSSYAILLYTINYIAFLPRCHRLRTPRVKRAPQLNCTDPHSGERGRFFSTKWRRQSHDIIHQIMWWDPFSTEMCRPDVMDNFSRWICSSGWESKGEIYKYTGNNLYWNTCCIVATCRVPAVSARS